MAFSFPSNPTIGQTSIQNSRTYQWNGYTWDFVGNVATHSITHTSSGTDPLTLTSSQVSDFNSSVSGLIPNNTQAAVNLYLWSNFK